MYRIYGYEPQNESNSIITAGFCAVLVLMSLLIYVSLKQSQNLNDKMSKLIVETNSKTKAANAMRDSIRLRAHSLKAMALVDDPFLRDEEL